MSQFRELSDCGVSLQCHRVLEDAGTGELLIVGRPVEAKELYDLRLQRGECAIRISKSLIIRAVAKLAKDAAIE